jgi:hypothetical protein
MDGDNNNNNNNNNKAITHIDCGSLGGCHMVWIPQLLDSRLTEGDMVQSYVPAALYTVEILIFYFDINFC